MASSLDPYPERSAEEVFMGLFHEVQGSGPPFRPAVASFTGPKILQHLVTGCLRIQAKIFQCLLHTWLRQGFGQETSSSVMVARTKL